jgi:hypothetical protein
MANHFPYGNVALFPPFKSDGSGLTITVDTFALSIAFINYWAISVGAINPDLVYCEIQNLYPVLSANQDAAFGLSNGNYVGGANEIPATEVVRYTIANASAANGSSTGVWAAASANLGDWFGFAVNGTAKLAWARNITQSTPAAPLWNNGAIGAQNPAGNIGGIDISTGEAAPWSASCGFYVQIPMFQTGDIQFATPMGLKWNFGQVPFIGVPPVGYGDWPPAGGTSINVPIIGSNPPKQMPAADHPLVDPQSGITNGEWLKYFQARAQKPPAGQPLVLTSSPFTFEANNGGTVYVIAGIVSDITLIRGNPQKNFTSFSTALTSGAFPLERFDQIQITYSSPPTVVFMPSSI